MMFPKGPAHIQVTEKKRILTSGPDIYFEGKNRAID